MRSVGVHKTTTVSAEHFDRDLRCDRTLGDSLFVHPLFFHDRFAVGSEDGLALRVLLFNRQREGLGKLRFGIRF